MNKSSVGIVIANLGSPKSPDPTHVGQYLNEFLTDPYVINLPTWIRHPLVRLGITPMRKHRSAAAYQSIWNVEGGPLRSITQKVAAKVEQTTEIKTLPAMRYGTPTLRATLEQFRNVQTILLAMQYPQHADSTRTTTIDYVENLVSQQQLIVAPPFYDNEEYLQVLSKHTISQLHESSKHLLISFHSLPEAHVRKADPTGNHCLHQANCCILESVAHSTCYRHQCLVTGNALGSAVGLPYTISFQSRLGRAKWLAPATDVSIKRLASNGVKNLAVVCPGFTADNLETLEEIGLQGKETFLAHGGKSFQLVPCLNTDQNWINFLSNWILGQLQGRN